MDKAKNKALERVFCAEIDGALPFQSKAKIYGRLRDEGLVAPMVRKFGNGSTAVVVQGWQLTHLGRLLYCSNC